MMSDDIVTRLREEAITIVENNGFWLDVPNAFNNCADEIERLRDEIERLRKLGDALADTGGQHGFDKALDDWKDYRND